MVRRYRNQNYSKLKRDHQQRGELFTDPEFPPSSQSLFRSGTNKYDIVWKRPRVRKYVGRGNMGWRVVEKKAKEGRDEKEGGREEERVEGRDGQRKGGGRVGERNGSSFSTSFVPSFHPFLSFHPSSPHPPTPLLHSIPLTPLLPLIQE